MKRKIGCIKDIELEKLGAIVKLKQEKLQTLTEKLSLLTEGMLMKMLCGGIVHIWSNEDVIVVHVSHQQPKCIS